jgi:hypothetical protein
MRERHVSRVFVALFTQEFSMRTANLLTTAALIGATAFASVAPVSAAPLVSQPGLATAVPSNTETVQWRRGYRHGGYGYRRGYGGGGAVLGGLAAGALIGGAIAASNANAAAQQNAAYCSQRYRSYDPGSGTYMNNDGNRYPCP